MCPFPNVVRNTVTASLTLSRRCVWQTYMCCPSESGKGAKHILRLNLAQQQLDSQREKTCRSCIYFAIDQLGMFCTTKNQHVTVQQVRKDSRASCQGHWISHTPTHRVYFYLIVRHFRVKGHFMCFGPLLQEAHPSFWSPDGFILLTVTDEASRVNNVFVFVPIKFRRGHCGH